VRVANQFYWQEFARCKGLGPDVFYLDKGGDVNRAKGICSTCPVRQVCYDYALNNERFGIWGEASAKQRKQARKELREAS